MKELNDHYPELEVLEIKHDMDHLHVLKSIPPKISVGKVVGIIKSNTSRRLKEKFPFLKEVYWGSDGIWSDGYFVLTVGINEEIIQKYIQHQGAGRFRASTACPRPLGPQNTTGLRPWLFIKNF